MDQGVSWTELDREQARHLADIEDFWQAWAPLVHARAELAGAVGWKTVKDRQYLTRYWQDEDTGEKRMTSAGPRSPETERLKEDFEQRRVETDRALAKLRERGERLARVGKALRLGRLDNVAGNVLRELWRADLRPGSGGRRQRRDARI